MMPTPDRSLSKSARATVGVRLGMSFVLVLALILGLGDDPLQREPKRRQPPSFGYSCTPTIRRVSRRASFWPTRS